MNHRNNKNNRRLRSGIAFALNYPKEFQIINFDIHKKARNATKKGIIMVRYLESWGWQEIELETSFVHSCMTTLGPKAWVEPTNYDDIFKGKEIKHDRNNDII